MSPRLPTIYMNQEDSDQSVCRPAEIGITMTSFRLCLEFPDQRAATLYSAKLWNIRSVPVCF